MQRRIRTTCQAFTLETLAPLSLRDSCLTRPNLPTLKGCYSPPKEFAIGLVLGLSFNGTRPTMQEIAEKLAIKVELPIASGASAVKDSVRSGSATHFHAEATY